MATRFAAGATALILVAGCNPATSTTPAITTPSSSSPAPSSSENDSQFRSPAPAAPLATAAYGYTITAITTPANEPGRVVTTPQLAGGDPAVAARFNAAMKSSMAGMPQNTPETDADDTTLEGGHGTGITKIGAGVVAGRIVLLWYGRGAAHPNRSMGTVVIDTRTAQPVTVDDLYRDPTAARARLRTLLPSLDTSLRLKKQPLQYEKFANWLPTAKGLEVYVSVPHVLGDFVPVIVPWERIAALFKPGVEDVLRAE